MHMVVAFPAFHQHLCFAQAANVPSFPVPVQALAIAVLPWICPGRSLN